MGCSLRESIPLVLIEWQRVSCGVRGRGECNEASLSSRQEVRSSGRLLVTPSPSLPVWHRRRVVGVVVVPGKHVRGRCVLAMWGGGLEVPDPSTPALPHPWPGWAAVSVGNSLPPGQPSGPTLQLSNSQAASRRRCCVAAAPQRQARLAPGFNRSGSAAAFFFASSPHKHTRPALLPLAVERPLESRLERKGLDVVQPALPCSARNASAISMTLACCLRGSFNTASNTWRARPAGAAPRRCFAGSLPTR